ncbi:CEL4b mannanase [Coprinopsis marcescibilis]|uniref:mannan endo-1,4-beta-mannosidase n=1 Tax=Coprinopsis marcescibilis TaxID=230819 RepID=A0A5C3KLY3_COPMA|nr:CEL4b mannanase [Coprinopsis marcescibilis]
MAAAGGPIGQNFVETFGSYFSLDGYKYILVGANAYWISLANLNDTDMDKAFADIAGMGATTVRVWGHNEMEESNMAPNGIYYQLWRGNKSVINYGPSGFGYFDRVIASARKHHLRLIVVLTSNYNQDYVTGGVETYITQVLGRDKWHFHDEFFTNSAVKSAYKDYIGAVVDRYKEERAIISWELGHHLKCAVSWNPQNPKCSPTVITSWVKEMSSHIKSIDRNHLVAVGDEGFYNRPNSKWTYNGRDGIDFEANLAIDTIDYGTFAYRPASYELPTHTDEPLKWIEEHGKTQARVGKPVVLADIGPEIRPQWLDKVVSSGIQGTLYWQAGTEGLRLNNPYWFEGDYVDKRSDTYAQLKKHVEDLGRRN